MLAAVYRAPGAASEVLGVEAIPRPEPGPGEVRVRVSLSGVNPTDWKARAARGPAAGGFQIPNQDGAGTIDAVGPDVDASRVGERVWVYFAAWRRPWGTAAQWTVVPAEAAVALPDSAGDALGASLGIPALTAHRCLVAGGPIDGATILVTGGAGAVGHFAIELAKWRGAQVIATVSSDAKGELATAAGADHVVNYREPRAAERIREVAPDGVDGVVEVALHASLPLIERVAARHAFVSSYANGGRTELSAGDLLALNLTLRFVLVYTMPDEALRRAVTEVSAAVAAGVLSELPEHRFALDQIADAHDAVQGDAVGKVLVEIPSPPQE